MKKKNNSLKLWAEAKKIIPGGSQLFGKRVEVFLPDQWPAYYKKAKGVEVWDLDGNKYIDMCYMGIGSCVLGFADPDVNRAVKKAVDAGSMTTLNCPEEVELAKLLLQIHPWAEMVRYARAGGEAMTIAVRLARAYSGKDKIAFCGYHGWHDWYLSTNLANDKNLDGQLIPGLEPKGVPRALAGTALPFHYNTIEELEKIVAENHDIGVIVVEPSRHQVPKDDFFKKVRAIADQIGAVMIIDEITVGWKSNVGGVHLAYGVKPDLAVYAKAMANGYPMAAIVGKKEVMQTAQDTFVSSTFWTERLGPAAALATLKKMKAKNVPAHLKKIGRLIQVGWKKMATKHGLKITIGGGTEVMPEYNFGYGDENQAIRSLLTQEMLKRGFLDMACVYVSYAHTEVHVKKYLKAVDEVFGFLAETIAAGKVMEKLEGPVAHNRFKRIS
jgi:glutamate-1-semialdehyde aminotransferase